MDLSHAFEGTTYTTIEQGGSSMDLNNLFYATNMFARSSIETIDVSNWGLSHLRSASGMFSLCRNLKSLTGSGNWHLDTLENAEGMFEGDEKLGTLDVSNWGLPSTKNTSSMFSGCTSLQLIGSGNWSLKNLEKADFMFSTCGTITLHAESWDLSKLQSADGMFMDSQLQEICINGTSAMKLEELGAITELDDVVESDIYKLKGEVYDDSFEVLSTKKC